MSVHFPLLVIRFEVIEKARIYTADLYYQQI